MRVDAFDFDLPEDRIALRPAVPRESARLLVVPAGADAFGDQRIADLPNLLRVGDLLVVNDSRVLPASLTATRPARTVGGGGAATITLNLHKRMDERTWAAFARPAKRLRVGDTLHVSEGLTAEVREKHDGGEVILQFSQAGSDLDRAIEACGRMPLPPYIGSKRAVDDQDKSDYQTMFAGETGSAAAPTAGLHYTPNLLQKLQESGVEIAQVTLHVGAGTFLPVKADNTDAHKMHAEWWEIPPETAHAINRAKREGRRVIAVGTTSLRTLESAASSDGSIHADSGDTDIFITPGYQFKLVDGLMTNFHLPKSTLFMLVSAFSGLDRMQAAYAHAIGSGYRFYSYGDGCLLWRR